MSRDTSSTARTSPKRRSNGDSAKPKTFVRLRISTKATDQRLPTIGSGALSRCNRQKASTTKGTKYHEGFCSQVFPSCTFVALVVNDFENCTTTGYGAPLSFFSSTLS